MTDPTRHTIRRYAHELYPHPSEWEVQPLAEAVPYLYARMVGLNVFETDWFELGYDRERRQVTDRAAFALAASRTNHLIEARSAALHADALLQGMSGEEAWTWAEKRAADETGEIAWERAVYYGVPVEQIKPYPVLNEARTHCHYSSSGNSAGHGVVTRIDMPESECPDCTEPINPKDNP